MEMETQTINDLKFLKDLVDHQDKTIRAIILETGQGSRDDTIAYVGRLHECILKILDCLNQTHQKRKMFFV